MRIHADPKHCLPECSTCTTQILYNAGSDTKSAVPVYRISKPVRYREYFDTDKIALIYNGTTQSGSEMTGKGYSRRVLYRRQRCPVQGSDPSMAFFFLLGTL
jgi:hypothetical protein